MLSALRRLRIPNAESANGQTSPKHSTLITEDAPRVIDKFKTGRESQSTGSNDLSNVSLDSLTVLYC